MSRRWILAAIVLVPLALATAALAQQRRRGDFGGGGFGGFRQRVPLMKNSPYDGRFTFVRMNYESTPDVYWYGGQPAWAHGYPVAEQNLVQIMNQVS